MATVETGPFICTHEINKNGQKELDVYDKRRVREKPSWVAASGFSVCLLILPSTSYTRVNPRNLNTASTAPHGH